MKNNDELLKNPIFGMLDHTMLKVDATPADIDKLCADAIKFNVASVCVPPCYVSYAKKIVGHKMRITTVVSFPAGNATTETKVFECKNAIKNGADELDVVMNLGLVKKRKYSEIEKEFAELRKVCKNKILKVIIEAPMLTHEEQIAVCAIATSAKVDYVKSCTGFGTVATEDDIKRLIGSVGEGIKVKASGGIKTLEEVEAFVALGASRIGESSVLDSLNHNDNNE